MMPHGPERQPFVPSEEREQRAEWTFGDLGRRVEEIYDEHDRECGYGFERVIAKIQANVGSLADNLEKGLFDQESINRQLTNTVIWVITFTNQFGMDSGKIMETQFGTGCPHCRRMPCALASREECKPPDQEQIISNPLFASSNHSLEEWQKYLGMLYPNNFPRDLNIDQRLAAVAQRIVDETVELNASCYQESLSDIKRSAFGGNTNPVEEEVADVLAWCLALANGLKIKLGDYSLEKVLIEKYKDGCPSNYCGKPKCECPKEIPLIYSLRPQQ